MLVFNVKFMMSILSTFTMLTRLLETFEINKNTDNTQSSDDLYINNPLISDARKFHGIANSGRF